MEQWIYVLRPVRAEMVNDPQPEESEAVGRHFAYLQSLLANGKLILAGRTLEEHPFGIVVFEAGTQAEAEHIMAADPAVQARVMTAALHPYRVALMRD